ncbi:MAG TPA: TonB-dependent receptor [Gemmatimonadaceae bacterium]
MKTSSLVRVMICLALLAAGATTAEAQGSSIRGTVTASDTHRPIAGARVSIDQPARVAITDANGRYIIRNIPARDYDVSFSALGAAPQMVRVNAGSGQVAEANAELSPGSLMLSSVIISATRAPTEARRVAATVNVLTPEQIRTSPARESQDLLREIPGVELPRTSSQVGGSAQIVSIRGVDEGRTVVTFDGVPITDAWGEWVDWSKVPKALLDRVEVIEGGTSNIYGNGAMGGSISFFSRPTSPGSIDLQVDGGSRDARHVFGAAGVALAPGLSMMVSGDYGDGGGYRLIESDKAGSVDHPSESIRRNAIARVEYSPSARFSTYVGAHLFSDNRDLGTPLSQTDRNSKSVDFGLDVGALESGKFTVRAWDGVQREDQFTSAIAANRATERRTAILQIPSHDWGGGAQWTRTGLGILSSLTVGGDFRHMNGFTGETDFAANGTTSYIFSGGDQVLSGAFAQGVLDATRDLRFELGARFDHWGNNNGITVDASGTTNYDDRGRNAFSPRAGIRWGMQRPISFHAAAYRAFRAPNLAELYRKFVSGTNLNLPNPALKPEYATGYEAGFDFQPVHWFQLKGTAYTADMKDFNTFVTIAQGQRQRQNVQKSRSRGGEAYLAVRPAQELMFSVSVNYDDAKIVESANPAQVGQRVGRVPVQKQVFRGSYSSALLGSLTVIGRHEGVVTTLQGIPLEPFTVFDANYQRSIVPGLSGFISVENIADTEYQVALTAVSNGIASLGLPRTIRIGLQAFRN